MDNRSWESGAAGSAPTAPVSPSSGYPTAGNPATPTPATKPGPYWYHQIGESLRNIILRAGRVPDRLNLSLLVDSIQDMINVCSRIRLTANTTFYVSTTGNDSNTGLSAGSPWLTIQKALDTIHKSYDLNGYVATIQLADGTYTSGGSVNGPFAGAKSLSNSVVVQGNNATPANVVVSVTGGHCFYGTANACYTVKDMKLQTTTSGNCIYADGGACITYGNLNFGSCSGYHIYASNISLAQAISNYSITGGATVHWLASGASRILASSLTITLTGTPAFSGTFTKALECGTLAVQGNTFSGSATGTRYNATMNGAIYVAGAGANYFPGSVAGTLDTGGQYV